MSLKPGGFLDSIMGNPDARICQSCANLVKVSEDALGCTAHDKLILPNYPPYHGNKNCADWASVAG